MVRFHISVSNGCDDDDDDFRCLSCMSCLNTFLLGRETSCDDQARVRLK